MVAKKMSFVVAAGIHKSENNAKRRKRRWFFVVRIDFNLITNAFLVWLKTKLLRFMFSYL